MKEIKRKVYVVKYKFGTQWYEFHCGSKAKALKFIDRKQSDPRMGVSVIKTK